jgi:hypothetical protein
MMSWALGMHPLSEVEVHGVFYRSFSSATPAQVTAALSARVADAPSTK